MCVFVFAKVVDENELVNLLKEFNEKACFNFTIVANWKDIWFERFEPTSLDKVKESEWGRAFGEKGELRWRRDEDGEKFLCRWIFDGIEKNELPQVEDAEQFPVDRFEEVEEEIFLLWGMPLWEDSQWVRDERGQKVWYVTRIPRRLVYPIDENLAKCWEEAQGRERQKPLCLRVKFYKYNGRPIFDRFVRLEAYLV